MFRITVQDDPASVTFRLEGRLSGSWVQELHDCWQKTVVRGSPDPAQSGTVGRPATTKAVRFDLTDVTFIDAAGKEFLAARYREGHKLIAAGCLMKFIVAEITGLPMPARRLPEVENERAV
jgi:cytochrome b subunit of formate dehydrogenase